MLMLHVNQGQKWIRRSKDAPIHLSKYFILIFFLIVFSKLINLIKDDYINKQKLTRC